MPITAQTIYASNTAAPAGTYPAMVLPAGYLATWTQTDTANGGAAAQALATTAGTAQTTDSKSFAAVAKTSTATLGQSQYCSPPLAAQSIAAGTWTLAWAVAVTNASSTHTWQPRAALYLVNGATGAVRTTIAAVTTLGAAGRTATGELTAYGTVTGVAAAATAGDYLLLEVGLSISNTGTSNWSPTTNLYADGATAISADNVAATNARAALTAPAALTYQDPPPPVVSPQALVPAVTIASLVGTGNSAVSGRGHQQHVFYGPNTGQWWCAYQSASQVITFLRSTDYTTWNAGGTFALATAGNPIDGRSFALALANLAGLDVVHVASFEMSAASAGTGGGYHGRGTLGATTITITHADAAEQASASTGLVAGQYGVGTALDAAGFPVDHNSANKNGSGFVGNFVPVRATGADTGTAWTPGWGTPAPINTYPNNTTSCVAFTLGGGTPAPVLCLADNNASAIGKYTNVDWMAYTTQTSGGLAGVLASALATAQDSNDWTACAISATDIHFVTRSGANSFIHRRFNGTSWSAGQTIPGMSTGHKAGSGFIMPSDGTNAWLGAIDSATGNKIQVIKWTGGASPAWDAAWTDAVAAGATRNLIAGAPVVVNGVMGLSWTQANGTDFDLAGAAYQTAPGTPTPTPTPTPTAAATFGATLGSAILGATGAFASRAAFGATPGGATLAAAARLTVPATFGVTLGGVGLTGTGTFAAPTSFGATLGGVGLAATGAAAAPTPTPTPTPPPAGVVRLGRGTVDAADPIDWDHPLNRGLIAWWRADADSAGGPRWRDLAGGHDGTLSGGPTWRGAPAYGVSGSLECDGVDDRVALPAGLASAFTTDASLILWLKRREALPTDGSRTGLVQLGEGGVTHYPWVDGYCYIEIFRTIRETFTPSAVVDRADWHQLAITTRGGGEWRAYQNGELVHATAAESAVNLGGSPQLGGAFSYSFDGWIASARLWNRELSPDELAADRFFYSLGDPGVLRRTGVLISVASPTPTPTAAGAFAAWLEGAGLTGSGTFASPASFAAPLAGTSLTAAGTFRAAAAFAAAPGGITLSAAAGFATPATFAATTGGITLAAQAGFATTAGFAAGTAPVTLAATARLTTSTTLGATLGGVALAGAVTVAIPATFAATIGGATLAAQGAFTAPVLFATGLGGASLAASAGFGTTATLAISPDSTTLAAVAGAIARGTGVAFVATPGDATFAGTAAFGTTAILAPTLGGASLGATAGLTVAATLTAPLAGATLAAEGRTGTAGTFASTLAPATLAAGARLETVATFAASLEGAGLAGEVSFGTACVLVVTLADADLAATGAALAPGAMAATFTVTLDGATLAGFARFRPFLVFVPNFGETTYPAEPPAAIEPPEPDWTDEVRYPGPDWTDETTYPER